MHNINFSQLSTEQVLAMADGLLRAGRYGTAAQLYALAMRPMAHPPGELRTRHGLAANPVPEATTLFAVAEELEKAGRPVFVGSGLATWNKRLPFFEDPRFVELADRHAKLLPMSNWHWNLQTALWAVQETKDIEGDLVELGVFKGHTTLFVAEYVEFGNWPKTWRLYDTFEGIPDDQLDPGWEQANRDAYKGTFSYEEVTERFAAFANIRVIKGRVPDVFATDAPDRISFLHMDLNNATAEVQALEALFERISPGGIILFDDYCWATAHAQHDAEKAWFAARGRQILPLPTGQGLFVKR